MLTVMMATRNGASTLPLVLDAYVALEPPPGGWKIVVADNGSMDGTKDVIHGYAGRLPLTYVFEPRPGKNQALNTALQAASGDLIVFTDDDAVPRPDWLRQLRSAADTNADFDIFGGTVLPRWPRPPEAWILALVPLPIVYAITPARASGPVGRNCVFGLNMAVRKAIFDRGYRFDATIGPRGTNYAQGSEAELTRRLDRAGHRSWFCSEAIVEHLIRPHQLEEQWVLQRARRYGRGQARLGATPPYARMIPGFDVPAALAFRLGVQAFRIISARARGDRDRLFRARWAWNYLRGQAQEAWSASRHRGGQCEIGRLA